MTNLAYLMFGQKEPRIGLGLYFSCICSRQVVTDT